MANFNITRESATIDEILNLDELKAAIEAHGEIERTIANYVWSDDYNHSESTEDNLYSGSSAEGAIKAIMAEADAGRKWYTEEDGYEEGSETPVTIDFQIEFADGEVGFWEEAF